MKTINRNAVMSVVTLLVVLAWVASSWVKDGHALPETSPGGAGMRSKQHPVDSSTPAHGAGAIETGVDRAVAPPSTDDRGRSSHPGETLADPESAFGKAASRKIFAYTGIKPREYTFATRDPEAVADAVSGYLNDMDSSWGRLNEVLDRIHAERLAAGDFQTIGVSERLPKSGDGVFVESTVAHDANRNEDVRRVTTVTWRQDPRLQSAHEDLEALKSGLRAMLLNNMNPKIASGDRDKR